MERIKNKLYRAACVLAALMLLLTGFSVCASALDMEVEQKTVRVGFFAFDGYHMIDEEGVYSGYGYDFMQMAARYNDWKLEFVGYDCSWAEMQTMLEKGEIDVLTSAQKTPQREEKFDFTTKSIGTSSILLTVRAGDDRYDAGNYASYGGMRVGLLNGNSRNDSFAAFAAEKGFAYTPVYFDTTEELMAALQQKKTIDAVVTSSLRKVQNELVLDEFNPSDFYAMVQKGNTALLAELNRSIEQMDLNSSGWQAQLDTKYYSVDNGGILSFTSTERNFLQDLKESGTVLRVIANPELPPYSYRENGEMTGIAPKIFAEIADRVGLQYTFVPTETREDYYRASDAGTYDIDLTCCFDYHLADVHGVRLTDAYMSTSMALLTSKNDGSSIKSIARVKGSDDATSYTDAFVAGKETTEYATLEQCVEAVLTGKVDGIYLYAYTAQKLIAEDVKNRLRMFLLPEYSVSLAIGVRESLDHRLLSVVNKGVVSTQGGFSETVVMEETSFIQENSSLLYLLYHQPGLVVGVGVLLVALLFLGLLFVVRGNAARKEKKQARELERFIGYVCKSYDAVEEVDLDKKTARRYRLDKEHVTITEEPFTLLAAQTPAEHIFPEDREQLGGDLSAEALDALTKASGGEKYFECRIGNEDSGYTWYAYTVRAIPKDHAHGRRVILFKKDINETKVKEEQQRQVLVDALNNARQASSAKGDFLSRMSHEIRTPLNAIIGYLSIAKMSDSSPEKILHCVDNGSVAAKHLLSIINDVLDMSSIESGRMKIAHEDFDLKKQIGSISTIFYAQAKAKNVTFEATVSNLTEEWVIGDPLRVNQVLMNLLSNAVKFTPENGKISFTIEQKPLHDTSVHIQFIVADTGIGMSEEYQKKLFTPFEQESSSTARRYGGSGLGLSITKNLTTMMNGSIEVRSKQGEGTTFIVTLPFEQSEENNKIKSLPTDFSGVHALVVDDEKNECDYVKALLKRCKVKCDTVQSGSDAVRQIRRRLSTDYKYDICIMDWNMPGMNGVQTAKQIHDSCDPDIPIIIATAYDISEIEDSARAAGVTKLISKPMFQSTMFDLLVNTFGKYQPAGSEEIPSFDLAGFRMLLVEDNPMNMEIALDVLRRSGLVVDTAVDGKQACEKFMAAPAGTYRAILMDIQMPIMGGYEATRTIRASSHPDAGSIPIIAMTANAFAEDVSEALANGMNDHISKPVDYNKLFRVLVKYLKN